MVLYWRWRSCGPAPNTLTVHSNFGWALDNPTQIKWALVTKSGILVCKQNYDRNYNFLYRFYDKINCKMSARSTLWDVYNCNCLCDHEFSWQILKGFCTHCDLYSFEGHFYELAITVVDISSGFAHVKPMEKRFFFSFYSMGGTPFTLF